MCYYFSDIIKLEDFDLDNILIDKKSYKNIMIYDISYKTLIDSKSLHIRFDQMGGFIRTYDGTRYLTLFGSEKYETIYERIRYLISLKSGIPHIFLTTFQKLKLIFMGFFAHRKNIDFACYIIPIKSVLTKDKNHYYKIFLEKCSYQLA